MWYTPEHTLTHNAIINMVIGPRGAGKTYGLKRRALKNWESKKQQFVYMRRYDSELKLVRENLFADINRDLGTEILYEDGKYKLEGEVIGWPIALTKAASLKSASFPHVTLLIFDEFIIDETQHQKYLPNEVDKFLNTYETIARMREDVKAFLLANSLSFVNPYSIYWNLKNDGRNIVKAQNGLVLCELWKDEEYSEAKSKTKFGQLIAGTDFEKMAVQNQFILDSDTFIEPKPKNALYYVGLIVEGRQYALWYQNGLYYIDHGFSPTNRKFTFDIQSHDETTRFERRPKALEDFFRAFKFGRVRFHDMVTKADMLMLLKKFY